MVNNKLRWQTQEERPCRGYLEISEQAQAIRILWVTTSKFGGKDVILGIKQSLDGRETEDQTRIKCKCKKKRNANSWTWP